jgi:zinc-ribbon domain
LALETAGAILVNVLQDLCPRCGAEVSDAARACPACGFHPTSAASPTDAVADRGAHLGARALALLAVGAVAIAVVSFAAGQRLQPAATAGVRADAVPSSSPVSAGRTPPSGRVVFAERMGDSLALESYRDQFTRNDTIAWRAELAHPPRSDELTLVITWVSIRERMELRETTVAVADPQLMLVGSDEVPLGDLVPTAGMYEVAYYDGDDKLAVGVFELLPPAP